MSTRHSMRVEKWKLDGNFIDVNILDEEDIEKNETFDEFEDTLRVPVEEVKKVMNNEE